MEHTETPQPGQGPDRRPIGELSEMAARPAPVAILTLDPSLRVTAAAGDLESFGLPGPSGRWIARSAIAILPGSPELQEALERGARGHPGAAVARLEDQVISIHVLPLQSTHLGASVAVLTLAVAAEEPVLVHQAELGLFFGQLPACVWTTDTRLRITRVSGSLLSRLELTEAQVVGRTVGDFLEREDPTHPALAHHRAALAGNASRFQLWVDRRAYQVAVEPLRDRDDVIRGTVGLAVDATEQIESEQRLAQSERTLAEAQRVAHVGSWVWTVDGDQVSWSEEMCRIYGVTEQTAPKSFEGYLSFLHPEDRERVRATILQAVHTGATFAHDQRILRADGSIRILHSRGEAMLESAGRLIGLRGSCWDITDRWEAMQEVERTVSLLRATLDSTADGILVVDRHARWTAFNRRFSEMWRIPEEIRESGNDDAALSAVLAQLEEPEAFLSRVRELYQQQDLESEDVLRFRDGRLVERYSRPQRVGNQVVGRVWSFRDVTDRERLYRRAIFLADSSRLLASLEPEQAVEAVAHLAVPLMGESCALDLFGEDGGPRRLFAVAADDSRPLIGELPRAALAGYPLIYDAGDRSCLAVPLETKDALLGILSFAAAIGRKYQRADQALAEELARRIALAFDNARLYRRVQEALNVRDEFLSIAAHELRGPATSLRLAVQTLRGEEAAPELKQKLLDTAERQVNQIARLIDELLDVSRIQSHRLHLDLELVDLAAVTRDVVSRLGPELARSGSPVSVTADASVWGRWDRMRLDQLVTNLMANAIKFGRGKPIQLVIHGLGERAFLTVRDHGIGVPRDRQQAIFQPFERAVSSRHYGGLGLGLYICRSIVEALGGSISVESEQNRGASFTVELPARRESS